MSLVLLSSDSADRGKAIARSLAGRLGYRELGREILARVAVKRSVEEAKMVKALEGSRGLLGQSDAIRTRCLVYLQEAVLEELLRDDVVCQGVAAHLFVSGASHALKVRLISDPETSAKETAAAAGVSVEAARKAFEREHEKRRRWSKIAFGVDESDPALYDLIVKTGQIGVERAVSLVAETLGDGAFRSTTYSRKRMQELLAESRARSALVERFPQAKVTVVDGRLVVAIAALERDRKRRAAEVEALVAAIPGVEEIQVEVAGDYLGSAAESLR
jgi:hypothetical protein